VVGGLPIVGGFTSSMQEPFASTAQTSSAPPRFASKRKSVRWAWASGQDFDGYGALQAGIAGAVHLAHPARANCREDFEGAQTFASEDRQRAAAQLYLQALFGTSTQELAEVNPARRIHTCKFLLALPSWWKNDPPQKAIFRKSGLARLCCEEMLYGLCFRADEPEIIIETCMDRANAKQGSSRRRQYPIKRHDSEEPCFGGLPVPAAIWIRAGDLLVSKHFHCLVVRKRCRGALPLKVDVVAAFGALEDDSVCFAHDSWYQFRRLPDDWIAGNLLQVLTGPVVNAILWRLFVTFIVIRRSWGVSRNWSQTIYATS
jgi:hypothetical protein